MEISPEVRLLIWDLDGTIIDSFAVYDAILREAAALRGLPMPERDRLLHNFHGSLDESIRNAFALVDGVDFEILLNDFLRLQENYYQDPESHIFADARNLAERANAAGLQQIIVTNREGEGRGHASPHYLIKNSSLKDYFSEIISGDMVAERKPAAAVLNDSKLTADLQPEHMLVIGDQFVDAQLAQNLGCDVVLVNRDGADLPHLDKLQQTPTIVRSLDNVTGEFHG